MDKAAQHILKAIHLFRGLDSEQIVRVQQIMSTESYSTGNVIFEQGSPGEKMYIIGAGLVVVQVAGLKGKTQLYLGIGQIVGEMALVDQGNRSATVIAANDQTTVYGIHKDDFDYLCSHDTHIGYVMMRNLAQDLSFKLRHQNFSI